MDPLEFVLLGHPRIERDHQRVITPAQTRVFALGAYLAMEGERPCPRGALAGLLWPDQEEERARHNLRQALSTLRRHLEPEPGEPVLDIRRESISLLTGTYRVDACQVQHLLDACASHPHHEITTCPACISRLEQARALYAGPFLDGFYLPDSDLYDDWLETWRQRLHERITDALDSLVAAHLRRGDHDHAREVARFQLDLDRVREATYRHLMRAHALSGNRDAALRLFDMLTRLLEDELGVEPDPETVALHTAIRDGIDPLPGTSSPLGERAHHTPLPLPVSAARLVGREMELAEIADLLGQSDCRLLTLHGPGGSGKTRLAIELAHTHADSTDELVAFVELAGVTSSEGALAAIATGLDLAPQGPGPPESQLLSWIRERPVFLVLDNAEHLVDKLEFIKTMLATAPGLTILVTSRERLGLPGEWIYNLPGLTWPLLAEEDSPEGYGAVALLNERIRQVRAGEPVSRTEQPDLIRICQLVEGMPLALEMAASWATTLSPAQIADGIRESLDFLEASSTWSNDRHRSMRAVIQSSWDRLAPEIQVTFRRLSVFDDDFTLDAAVKVANATAASLATLVNASMLGRKPNGRYAMHGLLAQFAAEQLARHGDERFSLHTQHSRHYLALVASHERELNGKDQPKALQAIEDDLANILAAWAWAIDHGDVASLLDAAPVLWLYYVLRGRMQAGARAFERLVDAFRHQTLPHVAEHDMLAAIAYGHVAGFTSGLGRYDEAIALLNEALTRLRTLVSGRCIGVALNMLAAAEVMKGDPDSARAHLEESLEESERMHDTWSIAFAVNDLGMLMHLHFGETDAAAYCERGRQLFRQAGDVRGEALAAHNLGVIATRAGDLRKALDLHREALALREAIGELWGVATSLVQIGMVSGIAGDRATAERYLRRALRLAWESSILPVVLEALVELAALDPDSESAHTTLTAIARHPSVQDSVRARCESLLAQRGESPGIIPNPNDADIWAIRTVDHLARTTATA